MEWGEKVKVFVEEDKARVGFFLGTHTNDRGEVKGIIQIGANVEDDFAYRGAKEAAEDGSGRTYREL